MLYLLTMIEAFLEKLLEWVRRLQKRFCKYGHNGKYHGPKVIKAVAKICLKPRPPGIIDDLE